MAAFNIFPTLLLVLTILCPALGSDNREIAYVYGTDSHGVTRQLAADRTPALYTSDFGDCLGGDSLFNISVFDAAYYADNMTVVFHLDGSSLVHNESTMMVITMEAYGEIRYTQTFDPCLVNIWDLCPLNSSAPLMVYGAFALVPLQTAAIPDIALQIPDFDGSVRLQIFSNSTQTEIGCYQAAMTNGNTLGIPDILAPTIAFFVAIAIICSFLTASYGISVPLLRAHYAHSLSVVLVLETLQSIFLSGALSLHWPSVLVAWWSNFAWSTGLIDIPPLVAQLGGFSGVNSNSSLSRESGAMFMSSGASQLVDQIYGEGAHDNGPVLAATAYSLIRRKLYNSSDPYDYVWGGDPVLSGVPLPGSWRSLSGTIGQLGIPGTSAFTLCLIWMLIAVVLFAGALLGMKGLFELLASWGWVRQDCMAYFRTHSLQYARQGALRVLLTAFPPLMTLAIYQFNLHSSPGSTALAAMVFTTVFASVIYLGHGALRRQLNYRPYITLFKHHSGSQKPPSSKSSSLKKGKGYEATQRITYLGDNSNGGHVKTEHLGVHQDDTHIKQFGWLSARYRAGCFWFFAVHLGTQFARACILGSSADNVSTVDPSSGALIGGGPPAAQLAVLLIFEVLTLCVYAYFRPLESNRNNALGVWVLGLGRTLVAALCIGLLPQIGISRIGATVIGFVIIVVQVLMLAVVVVLVAMDVVSTWLSLTRNQDDFYSEIYFSVRKRYLETLLASATGAPPPPTRRQQRKQEKAAHLADLEAERIAASLPPPAPSFSVLDVRRTPKIEDTHGDESDDDSDIEDFSASGYILPRGRHIEPGPIRRSRAASIRTGTSISNNNDDNKTMEHNRIDLDIKTRSEGGNVGSTNLVGMQIYEPARVIARLNRSRTSSAASFRSVPSLAGISDLPGPPQIGVLATGRRSASPFGGGRASPYSNRSPSVPRGRESDPEVSLYHETHEALANMFSGPVPRRMTPTRETLQRYTAERQSLQSLRSIQSMQSLQSHQSLQALPFRSTPVHYPAVAE